MARFCACMISAIVGVHALAFGQDAPIPAPVVPPVARAVYRLTLEDAQRIALNNNTGVALGRMNVQEKAIGMSAARADYFPKLLGNFFYFHFSDNLGKVETVQTGRLGILPPGSRTITAFVANQDSTFTVLTLAQPITKLIAVNAAVQLARADTVIAQAQLDKGTKDLLSGVAQAFHGIYGAQRIEAALNLQVQFAERVTKANTNPDIRIAMIEAQQALLQVRAQLADLYEQFSNLLGLPACTVYELVEPLPPPINLCSVEEAVQFALFANSQVQEAEANVTKARAGLQAANADFIPDVNIVGSYVNQTAASYIQPNFGFFGVFASYTFVDWGKRRHVRDQRQMLIAEASTNVQATIEKVRLDTAQAYNAYQQTQEAYRLAGDMAKVRKDAESQLKDLAALGAAKAATAKAELELIQAEIAYRVAHARLIGAIGK